MSADLASVSPSHFFNIEIKNEKTTYVSRNICLEYLSYKIEQKRHYKAAYTNIFKAICRSFSLFIGHKQGLHRESLIVSVSCSLSLFFPPPLHFPSIFLSIFPYSSPPFLYPFFRHSTSPGGGCEKTHCSPPPGSAPGYASGLRIAKLTEVKVVGATLVE